MAFRTAVSIVLLVSPAAAFRAVKRATETSGAGKVDMLYTYGAPGSASPSLRNPHHRNGCFPGMRTWSGRRYLNLTGTSDAVPQVTWTLGYRHAWMDSYDFDVRDQGTVRKTTCSQEAEYEPRGRVIDPILHARTWYVNVAHTISDAMGNLTDIATIGSYFSDENYVRRRIEAQGWKYISMASHPGSGITGGPQQVHLVQHPRTLECLITFQGSDSPQDWVANFATGKSHFCGFVDRDERCDFQFGGECPVKRKGNSFVHLGFRDHMRRMVRSQEFQRNIRPKFQHCSKLNVAGHSLGGAVSELFTACTMRAPLRGNYGYEEDYKYISFTKGTAQRLW